MDLAAVWVALVLSGAIGVGSDLTPPPDIILVEPQSDDVWLHEELEDQVGLPSPRVFEEGHHPGEEGPPLEPGLGLDETHLDETHLDGDCDCWNTTEDGRDIEVECRCGGPGLVDIPRDLPTDVNRITVVHAGMTILKEGGLQPYRNTLREIVLNSVQELTEIHSRAFHNLHSLRTVYINHAPKLCHIGPQVFDLQLPSLRILRIVNTGLENVPQLRKLQANSILHMVDLENNRIKRVPTKSVKVRTEQFLLNYNLIEEVESHAFIDAEIAKLSFKGNRMLTNIQPEAFQGLKSLRDLDLSETAISHLPTSGLKELEVLRLQDTDSLKIFPSIYHFEYLKVAWLTYPYHCCAFQFPATHDPDEFAKHEEFVSQLHTKYCSVAGRRRRSQDFGRLVLSPDNLTEPSYEDPDWGALNKALYPGGSDWAQDGVFHQSTVAVNPRLVQAYCGNVSRGLRDVFCSPEPDAFSPCEDLMGNWTLRGAVWMVAVAALVGNLAVLLVLLSSRFRMTVPKFLMCNLALADLCMGLYLLLIAVIDARSIGEYFNHAIHWQRGVGCQIAGFLTVFSSELSVYTLTVITSERWYAITHALHLDQRLRLRTAGRVMGAGWLYAVVMATLPLLGISGYYRTSICLPMENRDLADIIYLSALLLFNFLAFVVICTCYGSIYCAIRGSDSAAVRSDTTVAKRMALLVFTDFACWAPISFFGLTAVAGFPLINVTHTKILLVFFYPLNSCANPYLYALLTKQYRRDLSTLLSRHDVCSRKSARRKESLAARNSSTVPDPGLGLDPGPNNRPQRSSSSEGTCPRGSPHPLRNSNTRLNLSSEHEMRLKRALEMSSSDPSPVYMNSLDSHL